MRTARWSLSVGLVLVVASGPAAAGAPPYLPIQGTLEDAQGAPLAGLVPFRFAIHATATDAEPLWEETQNIAVERGAFVAYLGEIERLSPELFREHAELWLGVTVGADAEMPRVFVGSAAYASYAEFCGTAANGGGGGVAGTGTLNALPKWSGAGTLGDSAVRDNGGEVEINADLRLAGSSPTYQVRNASDPVLATDVATKHYVDLQIAAAIAETYTILYMGSANHTGNVGGRVGADELCAAEKPGALACTAIHAFLCVSAGDSVRTMPNNYGYPRTRPVYWYDASGGILSQVGEDWGDVLDGSIERSANAGTGAGIAYYYTGCSSDGAPASNTCSGFTSTTGTGTYDFHGVASATDATWLAATTNGGCSTPRRYLCACVP